MGPLVPYSFPQVLHSTLKRTSSAGSTGSGVLSADAFGLKSQVRVIELHTAGQPVAVALLDVAGCVYLGVLMICADTRYLSEPLQVSA